MVETDPTAMARELQEFASLVIDEIISDLRAKLDRGESLTVEVQRYVLNQLIKDRERMMGQQTEALRIGRQEGFQEGREASAKVSKGVIDTICRNRRDRADDTLADEVECVGEQIAAAIRALKSGE